MTTSQIKRTKIVMYYSSVIEIIYAIEENCSVVNGNVYKKPSIHT